MRQRGVMTLGSDRTGSMISVVRRINGRKRKEKLPQLPMKEIGCASDARSAVQVLSYNCCWCESWGGNGRREQ